MAVLLMFVDGSVSMKVTERSPAVRGRSVETNRNPLLSRDFTL
jgi:hypothetical protein